MPTTVRDSYVLTVGVGLLDLFIDTVTVLERTSAYFGYKEEYFMVRPYQFLIRKFKQFDRTKFEDRRYLQVDIYHALMAYDDTRNNKGKYLEKYLLDDYDTHMLKQQGGYIDEPMSSRKSASAQMFKQEDFDGFAFMPPAMKERLKQQES